MLGASFPRQAIEAVSDVDPADLDELLSSLVRKEVLTVRADKLSPERGQYAFTQSLIRSVAYDMLTRAERKARHLRTAEHLRSAFPDEGAEVAEVIGAHLYDAYKAAGDDEDADQLRAQACRAYALAGERAQSVGAPEAAEAAYLRAIELSSDEAEQAGFTHLAGRMASGAGWSERAVGHYETAIAAHSRAGRLVDAAKVTASLANSLQSLGRGEQSITLLRGALASIEGAEVPPEVAADLQDSLGSALVFAGHAEAATGPLEEALTLAQHHNLPEPLAFSLDSKAILLSNKGRAEEARLLFEGSAAVARLHGITRAEMLAESNLADLCMTHDLPGAEDHARAALALARRWGLRRNEAFAASNLMYILTMAGRLDEAFQFGIDLLQSGGEERSGAADIKFRLAHLEALRGNADSGRAFLSACLGWAGSDDVQQRANYADADAAVSLAAGDSRHALEAAQTAIDEAMAGGLAVAHEAVRISYPVAVEAALDLGDLTEADRLAEFLANRPAGEVPQFLWAQLRRAKALVACARGEDEEVEEHLDAAETRFRELGYPYWTARAQLERAEWLARKERSGESAKLAREAASTFEQMGTAPMGGRTRALLGAQEVGLVDELQSQARG